MPCALEKIVMVKKANMRNLAFQRLKTLYLPCHVAYGRQAWQGTDLS